MELDIALLNTQHYKVEIKGKVEPSGNEVAPSPTPRYCSYWKGAFESPSTMVANFTIIISNLGGAVVVKALDCEIPCR